MKFYLYLCKNDSAWSYLTSNSKEFDEEDFEEYGIYLYATVTNIQEFYQSMDKAGFDGEYIGNFIERDLSHYDYNVLAGDR